MSGVTSHLLGPAALPIGAGLKFASQTWDTQWEVFKLMHGGKSSIELKEGEDLFRKLSEKYARGEKSEFAKWMDELGGDLMMSGIGNSIGEFASNSSGKLGEIANFANNVFETGSEAKDNAELSLHLFHLNLGKNYISDCEICKKN